MNEKDKLKKELMAAFYSEYQKHLGRAIQGECVEVLDLAVEALVDNILDNFVSGGEHERAVAELKQIIRDGQPHSDELEQDLEKLT